jgi:large subunit ribosomal protein L13
MKTYSTRAKDVDRQWHVIDASGKTLGRLATQIASLLTGKHKPIYVPYLDTGDYVIVLNAAKVRVTGKKVKQKTYYRHSGYPGGLKAETFEKMLATHPTRVIEHAVKGMLPHNRLGRAMFKKLKVYAGDRHPHQAQVAGMKATAKGSEIS